MAIAAKKTVRSNEVSDVNNMIRSLMDHTAKDNKTMLNLVKYMVDNPANFGPAFVTKYNGLSGTDLTKYIDTTLANLSPSYTSTLAEYLRRKDAKNGEKGANSKLVTANLFNKLQAPRTMFKRIVKALAYLQSIDAKKFTVQSDGAYFEFTKKDANGKAQLEREILSGRELERRGNKMVTQGANKKTGSKGANSKGAASTVKALKDSLEFVASNMKTEKGVEIVLNKENEATTERLLIALIQRKWVVDGEIQLAEIGEWIKDHMKTVKIDAKGKRSPKPAMSAAQAEAMQTKASNGVTLATSAAK